MRGASVKTILPMGVLFLKRVFDLALAIILIGLLALPILIVAALVRVTSPGPALYWSDRVGRHNKIFRMPKFRSMRIGTPAVATHLLANPAAHLTPIGSFLRKSSLDELPQLWSILIGDMSFVGPRPALFNQADLIALRTSQGIDGCRQGLPAGRRSMAAMSCRYRKRWHLTRSICEAGRCGSIFVYCG